MADSKKYTAHINRKGLDATGVTEDHARAMASRLGSSTLFIVEGRHAAVTTDDEGNVSVAIALSTVEPVPADLDDRVREFQRALYRQRPEVQGQEVLRGTADGPSPSDALGDAEAAVWDGDTDAPLDPPTEQGDTAPECDYPGCTLAEEHDGDHDVPQDDDAPADKGKVTAVDFSGKEA